MQPARRGLARRLQVAAGSPRLGADLQTRQHSVHPVVHKPARALLSGKATHPSHTRIPALHTQQRSHRSTGLALQQSMASSEPIKRFTLPEDVKPKNYNLTLEPDLEKFSFAGRVEIDLEVLAATQKIVFNSAELTYRKASVKQGSETIDISGADVDLDTEHGRGTLNLPKPLSKGTATVTFEYDGILNDQVKGFYRSPYTSKADGKERFMASTQFEAADARMALPCWDEPARKASFDVTLIIPKQLVGLSNMNVVSETAEGADKKKLVFAKTPIMSTYLLAFIVGEFSYLETSVKKVHSGENNVIRVYTMVGQEHLAKHALETAARCLPLYEKFFGMDYVLPKCDMIAIPEFASGAMENWGLITYRETTLLCDKANVSYRTKVFVALVVCHELAHMWFGNLVTMDWWKELWLNESFATYMEFGAVDELFPEWQPWSMFISEDFDSALQLDALLTSHPVEVDVVHAHEIDEIFDDISYAKGCSIMRMLVAWIGKESFQTAMQKYLEEFKYKNATTISLWKALEAASKQPVVEVMAQWTKDQGYPVLKVEELADGTGLRVMQQRFLSARAPSAEEDNVVWSIPIQLVTKDGVTEHLLREKVSEIKFASGKPTWVKLNYGQTSVCRVRYSDSLLNNLKGAIESQALSTVDQAGILGDCAALVVAGQLSAVAVLDLAPSCKVCSNSTVQSALSYALGEIQVLVRDHEEAKALFTKYMIMIFEDLGNALGWEPKAGEDDLTKQLRGTVLSRLSAAEHGPTLEEARKRFAKYMESNNDSDLPADIRGGVYNAVVKFGGKAEWESVQKHYETAEDPTEKVRAMRALGSTRDEELLKATIAYAMSDKVRTQDTGSLLGAVAGNVKGTKIHEEYVTSNIMELYKKFGHGPLMNRIVSSLSHHYSLADRDRISKWWETVDQSVRRCCEKSMSQTLESITVQANLKTREFDNIFAYLKKRMA
ncbi:Aminopeptidase M1 [Diplonema papillatum]|nr:Aminopeptidase M1 [Diplonema papillatum]